MMINRRFRFSSAFVLSLLISQSVFSQTDRTPIFDVNGKSAANATVFATNEGSRVELINLATDGLFDPRLVRNSGIPFPPLTKDSIAHVSGKTTMVLASDGSLPGNSDPFTQLIVSKDGQQTAFVPPGFEGPIPLRRCGKIKLDSSKLPFKDNAYSVVITWKNSLAGRYAICGNNTPGDPKKPEHDWRFRSFFTVITVLQFGPDIETEIAECLLPPGEVSIAVISDEQESEIKKFSAADLSLPFEFAYKNIPATSGIHQVHSGESTTVQLAPGTCYRGMIQKGDQRFTDWNDLGLNGAHISISNFWTTRTDWIPGYDLSKGVNHYFDVLQSDVGLATRARKLASTTAILNLGGQFMTLPMPAGSYHGYLYRPGKTVSHPSMPEGTKLKVGVPLRPDPDPSRESNKFVSLVNDARTAIWQGYLPRAEQRLTKARSMEIGEFQLSTELIRETERLIARHRDLVQMYENRDPKYNEEAARFLLSQARGFVLLTDFARAQQVIDHAGTFPVEYKNGQTPQATQSILDKARQPIHSGQRRIDWYNYMIRDDQTFSPVAELGRFRFSEVNPSEDEPIPYRPLQVLRVADVLSPQSQSKTSDIQPDLSKSENKKSTDSITSALEHFKRLDLADRTLVNDEVRKLEQMVADEFDRKVQFRDKEIAILEAKLKAARDKNELRKTNRKKIIELQLRKLLNQNKIEVEPESNY